MKNPARSRFVVAWFAMFACATYGALAVAPPSADARSITLIARDRPVSEVLAQIAARFNLSLVSRSTLMQRVTVTFHGLSADQALAAVLASIGATYHREGQLVMVESADAPVAKSPSLGDARHPEAIALTEIPVARAAALVRRLYPRATVVPDPPTHALFVNASTADLASIRATLQAVDVPDVTRSTVEAVTLAHASPQRLAAQLRPLFPHSTIAVGPNHALLIEGPQADRTQLKSLIASIDTAPAQSTAEPSESAAVTVTQAPAPNVARAVAAQFRHLRVSASGNSVVLTGAPDEVASAKALVSQIDEPGTHARFTSLYRLKFASAKSVQTLLQRTFPDMQLTTDPDLNVVTGFGTASEHARFAQAIAQLDQPGAEPAPQSAAGSAPAPLTADAAGAAYMVEVVNIKASIPSGTAGNASTTPADIATTVAQTLGTVAPDLRLTPVPNEPQLIVSGSPYAVKLAKQLIARIDIPKKLVVLDTQILEINESVAKNLGFSFAANAGLTTTYSETTPQPNAAGNAIPLLGLQPLSRTPLSLQFQLGLAISQGRGRILADPRITTLSGKTASIRAGDNITVLTQTAGGTGVATTTQLQTFNTGVSLDITPIVNDDNYVTINLHPVVNNVSSFSSAGIPQISTRDTQTTIGIQEGQTVVIGGLLQDNATRTTTKIPLLGDLPLIGQAFRNESVSNSRDELVITITPHIIDPQQAGELIPLPPPAPIPTWGAGSSRLLPANRFRSSNGRGSASPGPIVYYGARGSPNDPVVTSLSNASASGPHVPPPAAPASGGTFPPIPGVPPNPLGNLPFPFPGLSPQPSPSAFGNTNVFTFGNAPSNNYAGPNDQPQIFFATLSPTVLHDGTNISVSAITTTNVTKVTLGFGTVTTSLTSFGTGKWQATYAFSTAGMSTSQQGVALTMTASRADGGSTSISIPVSLGS